MSAPLLARQRFHRQPFIDYQLLRAHALGTLPLEAAQRGAARVSRPEHVPVVFGALADEAEGSGRFAEAVGFARVAEFFSPRPSALQEAAYERYLRLWDRSFGEGVERLEVRYDGGTLPTLRRRAHGPKRGTVVAFGGFDSLIEEFDPIWRGLAESGLDVVAFDGPGQGGARTRFGLPHTHDWERPVAAVADHLGLTRFAVLGLSMGGYWAVRAAAFEPRVAAAVAWSPVYDWLARIPRPLAHLVRRMVTWRRFMNASLRARMRLVPIVRHVVSQATWMSCGSEPVDAVRWLLGMHAEHIGSERVRVPVLLMVGERDRFQPPALGDLQARALTAAEVTVRRFTAVEGAAGHMQFGNLELAIGELSEWLREQFVDRADRSGAIEHELVA
jgi:pimeloyl-ACP methyl ester carboxylesterase